MLALVALGHDGRRVVQLMALALPVLAWLAWPVHGAAVHRVRAVVVCVWALLFAGDAVVRAYLLDAYRAAPDSTVVLAAAANTTAREAGEYLSMHWRALAVGAGLVAAALWLVARSAKRGVRAAALGRGTAVRAAAAQFAGLCQQALAQAAPGGLLGPVERIGARAAPGLA
ncbi:phosphoethanolamine transferase domain-containing protein [Acidovorax sp.]|uniref:phosphoethanolamine transferase domain-containing protein n=1 Tax=Acidovorax sp. TaxID=1872122 RepID=UPI0034598388